MREQFNVYGMHCAMCAMKVEKALNAHPGVRGVVKLDSGVVVVDYDASKYRLADFKKEIRRLGYRTDNNHETFNKVALILGIVITIFFLIGELRMLGVNIPTFFNNPYLGLVLSSIVLFTLGLKFYYHAFHDIKNLSLGMDVLVSLGITSAYGLSIYQIIKGNDMYYFASVVMITTLVSIGKLIEAKVKHNTSYTVSMLSSKIASLATLIEEDEDGTDYNQVNVSSLNIGDKVLVKQGEVIPVDGIITRGLASVDEAIITGESKLVSKKVGSKVLASTILVDGTIEVKVNCKSNETFISKVIEAVEAASLYKPPIERLTNKIANIFVPAVLLIALTAGIIWGIISKDIEKAIVVFASVVLVSCPCALGLATPMAILVGSNRSANLGILYKSGDYLEYARKIKKVYFDKTKTLTYGNMEVASSTIDNISAQALVSLEKMSNHPIAKAICSYYPTLKPLSVGSYENIPGVGIKGIIDGKIIEVKSFDSADQFTTIQVIIDNVNKGYVYLADKVRLDCKDVIARLHSMNISTCMLTGDSLAVAKAVGEEVGIKEIKSSLNPLEKAEIIKESKEVCAYVGDGINDAIALKSAGVGFSVSDGTDISISASDVVLLKDNLNLVCDTIAISKITFRNIIENLCFAFLYNIIAIPLACLGITTPVLSSIMMALSNLLVVSNAIRIKYVKIR